MGRPKNPQKLLEEALANGDLEAAKVAMAKLKEKPKTKPVKAKKKTFIATFDELPEEDTEGAVILKKYKKDETVDPFRVQENNKLGKTMRLKTGVKLNKFEEMNDPKALLNVAKEDKKALKGKTPASRDRPEVDIEKVKVKCDNCQRVYEAEKWDVNRQMVDPETKERYMMENLCVRCIYK